MASSLPKASDIPSAQLPLPHVAQFLQNQPNIGSLSGTEMMILQQALHAQRTSFQQQLKSFLMYCGTDDPTGNSTQISAPPQMTASSIIQNQVRMITITKIL
jgi:hypothetical protein